MNRVPPVEKLATKSPRLLSLNVARPRLIVYKGQTINTGIFKQPVAGPVSLRTLNLDGDRQADLTVHGHGVLKSAPRGYPVDHPRIDLLRFKGLTAWRQWPVEGWLETPAAKDRVISFFRTALPLCSWLTDHVGR